MSSVSPIENFYRGKTIFLTGATGYLGRFVLFKIFKQYDVKRVYILVRGKGKRTFEDRVNEFKNIELFKKFLPDKSYVGKMVALEGDICQPNCGLNEEQRRMLQDQVDIVIHSAASIRFTAPVKSSIRIHVSGTQNVIELASTMNKLQVFIHVSSISAWMNRDTVPESIPDSEYDAIELSKRFQNSFDYERKQLESQFIGSRPKFMNSYSFTKSLAELVVNENKHRFKRVAIVRPPFLVSSHAEPLTGWFDEPQEGVSLGAACSFGLCRMAGIDMHQAVDALPVDVCVNGLLAVTWYMVERESESNLKVFNMSVRNTGRCTGYDMLPIAIQLGYKYPSIRQLRPPIDLVHYPPTKTFVSVKSFFTHTLFSILFDIILLLIGQKPMLYDLTRKKISAIFKIFQAFRDYKAEYNCELQNMDLLYSDLSETDRETLFYDLKRVNWYGLAENGHLNFRRRVLNEPDETLPYARKRLFYISRMYTVLTYAFHLALVYLMFKVYLLTSFYSAWLWPIPLTATVYFIYSLYLDIDESAFTLSPQASKK